MSFSTGQTINFQATVSCGTPPGNPFDGPYVFSWVFGDGATASGQNVTHTYSVAGNYTPTVSVVNHGTGAIVSVPTSITVQLGMNLYGPISTPFFATTGQNLFGSDFSANFKIIQTGTANQATNSATVSSVAMSGSANAPSIMAAAEISGGTNGGKLFALGTKPGAPFNTGYIIVDPVTGVCVETSLNPTGNEGYYMGDACIVGTSGSAVALSPFVGFQNGPSSKIAMIASPSNGLYTTDTTGSNRYSCLAVYDSSAGFSLVGYDTDSALVAAGPLANGNVVMGHQDFSASQLTVQQTLSSPLVGPTPLTSYGATLPAGFGANGIGACLRLPDGSVVFVPVNGSTLPQTQAKLYHVVGTSDASVTMTALADYDATQQGGECNYRSNFVVTPGGGILEIGGQVLHSPSAGVTNIVNKTKFAFYSFTTNTWIYFGTIGAGFDNSAQNIVAGYVNGRFWISNGVNTWFTEAVSL